MPYSAFLGARLVAEGELLDVLPYLKKRFDEGKPELVQVFEESTGKEVDFDLRGTLLEVITREATPPARTPGRPKLGIVSREVSLLPRHWEWLERQPNGISATLRRLIETASKTNQGAERARDIRAALSRFVTAMGGDRPGYEEATRALFAGDQKLFEQHIKSWPKDIRAYAVRQSRAATDAAKADGPSRHAD